MVCVRLIFQAKLHSVCVCFQALRWCDEGAYLLASQMVDRFQTREGAQEALQRLGSHQEMAPSALRSNQDILSLEFEATLTPQLQVGQRRLFQPDESGSEPSPPCVSSHRSSW